MADITPSSELFEHTLDGTPINYATLGCVTVVADETYDEETFEIDTDGPQGQEIAAVDSTDIMLTSAPEITNDGTNYYMHFEGNLAIMVESSTAYFLLQQTVEFDANLGLMTLVTPPAEIDLPLVTLNAAPSSFTTTTVKSIVTVGSFEIPVGERKSVKVALNTTDAIDEPIFCEAE